MHESDIREGARVGEYVLEEKIGEGGFASVWKAVHHVWTDRVAAVKIPTHRGLIDQLRKEAQIQHDLETLDDAHIVKTLGLDASHEPPYFVMELVEGRTLRALLAGGETPALPTVLDWAEQILMALDHAHRAGVIHMDLKPENVLVTPEGVVKLMDFGLGYRPSPRESSLLLSGELKEGAEEIGGTLEYMAPEVRAGEGPDPRADLYAFGVILFEMLTGERPQPGDRPSQFNDLVPPGLDEIFEKCYARASRRFESVGPVLEAIRRLRRPASPASPPAGAPTDAPIASADPPPGMVLVPAGSFTMGKNAAGDSAPEHTRALDAFFLDTTPVTCRDFSAFVRDGGYENEAFWEGDWERVDAFKDAAGRPGPRAWSGGRYPSGRDRHPVTGVSFFEARAYARWAGKRLPAEAEWEKAARGDGHHDYPYGPRFDAKRCNTKESGAGDTTSVNRYARGASPFGVLDLSGNVLEWTASFFKPYPGNEDPNPAFGEFYRVLRGGAWYFKAEAARITVRHYLRPDLRLPYVGFRCARDLGA